MSAVKDGGPAPIGPKLIVKHVCDGCPALTLDAWTEYLDNDEKDTGTTAYCGAIGKTIDVYYREGQQTPDWCPAMLRAREVQS